MQAFKWYFINMSCDTAVSDKTLFWYKAIVLTADYIEALGNPKTVGLMSIELLNMAAE